MNAARRKLKLWEALALSLGLMGPTLAMAGNGQGLIAQVGSAVPLVFLLGAVGVGLVAYGFARLTRRYNHSGSAYALVGVTMGPRAGFVAGFTLMGTYLFFSICTVALLGAFLNAFLAAAAGGGAPPQVAWIVTAVIGVAISAYLNVRDTSTVARWLLVIEGFGIAAMIVLAIVIFAAGGNSRTGVTFEVFTFHGTTFGSVIAAVVAAFLSWAGFEGCAALGEETDQPRRNIPRALFGSVLLTGVLFVVVMFAQTIGFGTDPQGLKAFGSSGNTLGDLANTYVGRWFALLVIIAAVMSAFGSNLSSVATASRLMFALARDGFGPRQLAQVSGPSALPRNAVGVVFAAVLIVDLASYLSGWPHMGTGNAAIDSYFYFAVTGATCVLVVYLLVELAVFFAARRKLISVRMAELVIPGLGAVFILMVIWYGLRDQVGFSPAYLALIWVAIGVVIALTAPRLTKRIGASLAHELGEGREDLPDATEELVDR
ncbi:MAG TPA: APC family permease [Segeticoccus sp.]|uniref:APC family permease n=1 Tax=Segeticoccus sp. TaxID=2706531 RepID=UPI002D80094F|nr:APC family permease [Segeticoccus sp.]HET8598852.1 APC family permease [Segeticoccus sp.]